MSVDINIWANWTFRFTVHTIISIFFAIFSKGFYPNINWITVFLPYFLIGLWLMSCAFVFAGMFEDSKKAVFTGVIWFILHYMISILIDSISEKTEPV